MPKTDPTDTLIAIRCQLGDRDAWDELVQRWHPRLRRLVARLIVDDTIVEDLMQTIWLRITRGLGRLQDPERLGVWLYRVARAAVVDRWRQQYRQPTTGDLHTEALVEITTEHDDLDWIVNVDALEAALRELGPREREVVVLHYLEERPLAQVAEICDTPIGTLKSRLHRARRLLRDRLTE